MIDATSLEILKILQEKARIPNIEVSRRVGLAPSAVLERIRKMEKQGIIDGYEVRLDPEFFQQSQIAFIFVTVQNTADTQVIEDRLAAMPEIQEVHFIAGDDCYFLKVRTTDTMELGSFLREKITTIEGVTATRTATVLSTIKETSRIPIR